MYGNNVRLSDAVVCYNACNGRNQSRVEPALRAWNDVWDRDMNQTHTEQYYSMLLKCLARINGNAPDQYEVVKPVFTLSKYDPLHLLIRQMIESTRSTVE